jgi:DNA-binding transcriptional MerR regulator
LEEVAMAEHAARAAVPAAVVADDPGAEVAGISVSVVARRLGVAAATLRTWDRRYGVSPSLRTEGSHRRYTPADVALLERMQGFMLEGMSPGDAARLARFADHSGLQVAPEGAVVALPAPPRPAPVSERAVGRPAAPSAERQQRGLARAAFAMDSDAGSRILRHSIATRGAAWTWDQVIAPVMRAVGEKYAGRSPEEEDNGIDVEHHLSHIVIRELARASDIEDPVNGRPVLLASAPDEQHTLPLYALSAALAERGIASRVLGGRLPDRALASAIRRTGPVAVFLWAQSHALSDLAVAIPPIRPAPAVLVGGPGWDGIDLPDDVAQPGDLVEALTLIGHAVRPSAG